MSLTASPTASSSTFVVVVFEQILELTLEKSKTCVDIDADEPSQKALTASIANHIDLDQSSVVYSDCSSKEASKLHLTSESNVYVTTTTTTTTEDSKFTSGEEL